MDTADIRKKTLRFFETIMEIPSVSGQEERVAEWIARAFEDLGLRVEHKPVLAAIADDPLVSAVSDVTRIIGKYNLAVTIPGQGKRKIAMNTHLDTVVPATGMKTGIEGSRMYGRGACDVKGQIAALYYMASKLIDARDKPTADITIHLVLEEETGGNGSLAMDIQPGAFDAALVLEPTGNNIFTAARGVVWFRLTLHGKSGHSGDAVTTRNAILLSMRSIRLLEEYHSEKLAELGGKPPFDKIKNPMPLVFGKLHSGSWPAIVPDLAVLEGIIGVLPGTSAQTITREIDMLFQNSDLKGDIQLEFTLCRDASVVAPDSELVCQLKKACEAAGVVPKTGAFPACCDAFFYSRQGIPTAVIGAGNLLQAHSAEEYVELSDIYVLGDVLCYFVNLNTV
jgi:acetylornithine deacetylase